MEMTIGELRYVVNLSVGVKFRMYSLPLDCYLGVSKKELLTTIDNMSSIEKMNIVEVVGLNNKVYINQTTPR